MSASYEYATGSVRAKETSLFSKQDIDQMLACSSVGTLASYLSDKGRGSSDNNGGIDDILCAETAAMWDYLRSVTPALDIYNSFIYRNDVHNIKAVIKGILSNRPYDRLLLKPVTIDTDTIKKCVSERNFSALPDWISAAAESAFDVIAHNSDAQLADAILDKAAMSAMLDAADATGSQIIYELISACVFFSDVKIILRAARMKKSGDFIHAALCECDGVDAAAWKKAALSGTEELIKLLEKTDIYSCSNAIAAFKKSPSDFEREVDNIEMRIARKCKYVADGPEPVVGYLFAKEAEIKAIHMIASGIRTGQDEQTVRERLRILYG